MSMSSFGTPTISFVIVVAFMVGYWFYKYEYEDRNIGVVDYAMLVDAEYVEFTAVSLLSISNLLMQI